MAPACSMVPNAAGVISIRLVERALITCHKVQILDAAITFFLPAPITAHRRIGTAARLRICEFSSLCAGSVSKRNTRYSLKR